MTALANLTRTKAILAVTALLAVVFIAAIASCGGSGGSTATGFHDPKLLSASLARQVAAFHGYRPASVGGSPYDAKCHTTGSTMTCSENGNASKCPLDIAGTSVVCQITDTDTINVALTLTADGHSYRSAPLGSTGTVLTDSTGG